MTAPKIHTDYDPPPAVVLVCKDKSLTRQSEAKDCDINVIVARFEKTGQLPLFEEGFYADVSEVGDYRSALEKVEMAERAFMALPAKIREEYGNDPAVFLDALVTDPQLRERLDVGERPKPVETPSAEGGEGA